MKYVFCGDIHGKSEQVRRALDMDGIIVFVGDFIDSFDRTILEHDECYRLVIEAIKKKKARVIYGNHELSYIPVCGELGQSIHRSSGWNYQRSIVMKKYESKIREHFEPYIFLTPEFLVSHAGLTKQLWQDQGLSIKTLSQALAEWWLDRNSPMHYIGRYRGGRNKYGGLFWCDFNQEFEEVPELSQIFGHTPGPDIRYRGNSFCIDCLDRKHQFLELDIL